MFIYFCYGLFIFAFSCVFFCGFWYNTVCCVQQDMHMHTAFQKETLPWIQVERTMYVLQSCLKKFAVVYPNFETPPRKQKLY